MKNDIEKAFVNFLEDLLYFQHFVQIFVFAPNHHLKERCLIITNISILPNISMACFTRESISSSLVRSATTSRICNR